MIIRPRVRGQKSKVIEMSGKPLGGGSGCGVP